MDLITIDVDAIGELPAQDGDHDSDINALESNNHNAKRPDHKDGPEMNGKSHRLTAPGTSVINIQMIKAFKASVLREFPELFDGRITLMKEEVLIALHEDAVSSQAPICCVAQSVETPLKTDLDHLVSERILVKINPDEPSDMLHSFVCVKKNMKIHWSLNPTQQNKYFIRLKHNAKLVKQCS